MKHSNLTIKFLILILISFISINTSSKSYDDYTPLTPIVITQTALNVNNVNAWIINTGIFDRNMQINNAPGFEWPYASDEYAIFSAGLTIAAMVNGNLRMAAASYRGEYAPGYIVDSSGIAVARTDSRFRIWSVLATDNETVYDVAHWGDMVPYGAPFNDLNHNGVYDVGIDKPGIPNSDQTIFICMTDGFTSQHTLSEGFGGGTAPLFAEVHLVAWAYKSSDLMDVQFFKWEIINKSHTAWNSTYFSIVCDPDVGCGNDDYIGCDTSGSYLGHSLDLGFAYNGEEVDCAGSYRYPGIVPSCGIVLLEGAINQHVATPVPLKMTSFDYFTNISTSGPACEKDPNGDAAGAYNFMKGIKKDQTPWVIPPGGSASYVTKYCYPGDPETGSGWTEGPVGNPVGSIWNCGGPTSYTGVLHAPNAFGDRRFIINSGADNLTINPGEKQTIAMAQMIAQGGSRLNSVTHLKQLCYYVKNYYYIGIKTISNVVPCIFHLYQNYPNPFNPGTKIKFDITSNLPDGKAGVNSETSNIILVVYDILGKEVAILVNEKLQPGTYEVEWNASGYPSGVYFYKLVAGDYSETKKMLIIK